MDATRASDTPDPPSPTARIAEAEPLWLAPAYFLVYLAYLFATLESDRVHWVTLVLIPAAVAAFYAGPGRRLRSTLASFGLEWGKLTNGLGLTLGLGVAVTLFQIGYSRMAEDMVALLTSSRALIALPVAFVFLLLFTGTTEEFFFRGFLQTRLERVTGSRWGGLVLASLLFGLYHLPYAYLNPRWPSSGDWGEALVASFGQGVPGGLILGGLFLYTKRNLMAPLLLHVWVDLLPAATMIKFGEG